MAYTLISFVGTGIKKDGEYQSTRYVFPDKKEFETKKFAEALLELKYRNFSKVVFVGTTTSAWEMLAEGNDDLCMKLMEARSDKNFSDELKKKLENYLSEKLQIPVVIKYHTDKIDEDTSLEIFNLYSSIVPEITDENILVDVTHSFRSMPILLYQAMQFSISQNEKIKNVELVYGEYTSDEKCSYVRNLSSYWKYSQITNAVSIFEEKLDGFALADLIEKDWEAGCKAIKRFSEVVQTNFCLQIVEVSKQLKNSLRKYPENAPAYLDKVKNSVEKICKLINSENKSLSLSLYEFSKFLYEHKLNVQAVICLQVAVETAICEHFASENQIGDYDWWKKYGQDELKKIESENKKDLKIPLTNLEYFRNQVAHGGAKNRDGNFPHAANIPSIYESGLRGAENLIKILEQL
ncbi:MAG: TIGR02221 family CRISPR-associated protein [Spirochaetales bacterium]|nr:TIGR02221 family CRISPR-associated protein [Spirochaetales bacterium]